MFKVEIPTCYLYEKLQNYLSHCNLEATARMYSMFIQIPTSRATADYMLEDSVNDIFPNGGQWKIKHQKANCPGPKYMHQKADLNATTRYLLPWLSVPWHHDQQWCATWWCQVQQTVGAPLHTWHKNTSGGWILCVHIAFCANHGCFHLWFSHCHCIHHPGQHFRSS